MNEDYNSRQRKIYNDYKGHSSDSLLEIVKNGDKYLPEVIEVIYDILIERDVVFPRIEMEEPEDTVFIVKEKVDTYSEESFTEAKPGDDAAVKLFVKKLSEKTSEELSDIITHYISYEPETVEAALIVSVDKGLITYDLKGLLLKQISINFSAHLKHIKQYKWEKNNAFIKYVSGYQDDEIYRIIENPSDIVIDVYHAILITAKERELISEEDFNRYYQETIAANRSEYEIRNAEIDMFFRGDNPPVETLNEEELEAEREKFWKCPKCGELVEMEFGVCWKCQGEVPETIEHPDKDEILKQRSGERSFNPVKIGFTSLILGALICLLTLFRGDSYGFFKHLHYEDYVIGGLAILAGIGFIIYGLFFKSKSE
jgi:hypothetical protein